MPIVLVKREGEVVMDRDDHGFFRVTLLPELAYSLFRVARSKGKKLVIVPSQIVLNNRENGERFFEWYLELQSLIDNVDIHDEGDNREKTVIREKMNDIVNFYRKNRINVISASFEDIVTKSSLVPEISYYSGSDQIMIGNRENVKLNESDLLAQLFHELGHRLDRCRKSDGFDKEIFAFDKAIKWLMKSGWYNESRHEDMIVRMNGYMKEKNIHNVFDDNDASLAERIILYLEKQYRDPVIYDDYDDEQIERFNSNPDVIEATRDANDWHQRNEEQSYMLQDTAQTSWEVYGEALEQADDEGRLTNKQQEYYQWIESPEREEFRRDKEKYGHILEEIYNLGEDFYKLREIGWHKI